MRKFVLGALVFLFVLGSAVPTFYELSRMKDLPSQYRSFELVHNYVTDYNFYLSRIREGWEGRVTAVERYTSEKHGGSFIQEFYILLGQGARFTPDGDFAVPAAYHVARFLLAILLLFVLAEYVRELFPEGKGTAALQVIAFLMVVTASTWPIPVFTLSDHAWRLGGFMPWWTVMDSLQRITFLPHILLGQAIMAFLLLSAGNVRSMSRTGTVVFLGILAFILGVVFPPAAFFTAAAFGVLVLLEAFADRERLMKNIWEWARQHALPRGIIVLFYVPTLLYFQYMLSRLPWRRLIEFDILNPTKFSYIEYAKALGPTFPLGLVGLFLVLRRKEKVWFPVAAWVIAWMVLIVVFKFIPSQSPLRFTEMAPHIPLGLLSVYTLVQAVSWINRPKRFANNARAVLSVAVYTLFFLPIVMGLGTMYSSWLWQKDFVDMKVRAGWPAIPMNNYIVYPSRGFMDAVQYIHWSLPADSVILSDLTAGNYIPAYAGKTVYVGHDNTVDKEKKRDAARAFFRGDLSSQSALRWLREQGITHVFYGPQEKEYYSPLPFKYTFMVEVYRNADVTIYAVP